MIRAQISASRMIERTIPESMTFAACPRVGELISFDDDSACYRVEEVIWLNDRVKFDVQLRIK